MRPFTDKQIELVMTFADQAVIAIENVRLFEAEQQRTRELSESLEQQTATSEVLSVISSSPGDLEPVFETLLANAVRICGAKFGMLFLPEGDDGYRIVALHGAPPAFAELRRREPVIRLNPATTLGRVAATKRVVQVEDIRADPAYTSDPTRSPLLDLSGARTMLNVPMLKDDELVGQIAIYRQEVRPFTDKQIALVQNFAAQAVIAIENTRLLSELRESLERQTATAEVLSVISSSPGELEPVFQAMLDNATRLCGAKFGIMYRYDNKEFQPTAMCGVPHEVTAFLAERGIFQPPVGSPLGELARTKQLINISDVVTEQTFTTPRAANLGGARSFLGIPMLKENELVGAINIFRTEVLPFTDKQIALVQNFAAQAVIAIENTRLLNELRQRTTDLTEALEQQTATSEVLQVISSSPGELEPVFQTMLANAVRICDAKFGILFRCDNEIFNPVAHFGVTPEHAEFMRLRGSFRPTTGSGLDRALRTKHLVRTADVLAEPTAAMGAPARVGSARSLIVVPMLHNNELIGAVTIYRQEVRPFNDKQIELVKNFAAQAVIAIENTRLLNELRQRTADLGESLEQQTATSEVLRVISGSPGDLKPVFDAMLAHAVRICDAGFGNLSLFDGKNLRIAAMHNAPRAYEELRRSDPVIPPERAIIGPVIRTKQINYVRDLATEEPYAGSFLARVAGARTAVAVPMLREGELAGAIAIYRQEVRPFTDKQIALVQNFAAQAVIAIENTRLLNELRESLEQQTATSEVLQVISSSLGDLEPIFQAMLQNAIRICDAKFGTLNLRDGDGLRQVAAFNVPPAFVEARRGSTIHPAPETSLGQVLRTKQTAQVADVATTRAYLQRHPATVQAVELGGVRTAVSVPLVKDNELVGIIAIYRQEVRPFTDKQVALLTSFAAQAVIAIENTRLLNELRQRTAELEDKGHQLQIASQHKSQFLANMSHELRTPLNAILGYTELMADGVYGQLPEKTMGVLKRLDSNGRHLLGLINDVLDLSKIEAGQLVLELTDYSLEDIAQTVRSTLEPLAADKKLAFKIEVAAKMPAGHGDGRRLTQVLINLVGNAIKFTDAGEVVITAGAADGSFHLSVRDTGPGISAADQAKLFQEFQQADNAITRKKGGTGLGLAISKRIVEMHGGKIWVESQVGRALLFQSHSQLLSSGKSTSNKISWHVRF